MRDLRRAFAAQALKLRNRFLSLDARATQQGLFQECVSRNADTAFGREHDFASKQSVDDYRAAVPIRHYHELSPWIERSAAGEAAVLTTEDPIRFWKTTGTTSQPKKIPLTPAAATRTMESFLTLQGTQLSFSPDLQ